MLQTAEQILDHNELFQQPEYQSLIEDKKIFEEAKPVDEVKRIEDWTKSWEYRDLNFKREAVTINPAKA